MAVKMISERNDMEFEPNWSTIEAGGDTCSIHWRISQVSCWTDWIYDPMTPIIEHGKKPKSQTGSPNDPHPLYTVYEPCDTSSCCARQFMVCRYGQDSIQMTPLDILHGEIDCDTVSYKLLPCYFTCDFLDSISILNKQIPPRIELPEKIDLDDIFTTQSLEISYTMTKFIIKVTSESEGHLQFDLYNILGKMIISKNFEIMKGLNIIEIDNSNLKSGTYLYNLLLNNMNRQTGKCNLLR